MAREIGNLIRLGGDLRRSNDMRRQLGREKDRGVDTEFFIALKTNNIRILSITTFYGLKLFRCSFSAAI